jgi:hypothetical protein
MVRVTPPENFNPPIPAAPAGMEPNVNLWMDEQLFEEDVRAVMKMMRPNARERLQGWKEYRTGGAHYRVTVSWDDEFEITSQEAAAPLAVPNMADVIESLLVGSLRTTDDVSANDEFDQYRRIVQDVYHRLADRQSCYE